MQKLIVKSVAYFLVNIVHRMGIILVGVSYVISQNTVWVKGHRISIFVLLPGTQENNYEPVLIHSYTHRLKTHIELGVLISIFLVTGSYQENFCYFTCFWGQIFKGKIVSTQFKVLIIFYDRFSWWMLYVIVLIVFVLYPELSMSSDYFQKKLYI